MQRALSHGFGVLLVLIATVLAFELAGAAELFTLVALGVTRDELDGRPAAPAAWLAALVVGALAMQALPWLAALAHPDGVRSRLGLVRPRLSWSAAPALLLASLACWALGAALALAATRWLPARAPPLMDLAHDLIAASPLGRVTLVLAASLAAGAGEEMLFRGFLQRSLLARWWPIAAIATATLASALVRGSAADILLALPAAAWFGVLAARTGSVLPGIACHTLVSLVDWAARIAGAFDAHDAGRRALMAGGIALVLGLAALAALTIAAPARSRTASTTAFRSRTGDA